MEETLVNPTFIFVDGSYYFFYRYHALMTWWKITYPEDSLEDPYENKLFVEKFKTLFVNNLLDMPKKFTTKGAEKPILIVGKDCRRENIWRNKFFPNYKGTRTHKGFMGKPFIKMVYEEELFQKGGAQTILKHSSLEADDCIAISVKHLTNKYPKCHIYVITSDKDYLQLNAHNVDLYNLCYKNIANNKSSTGIANDDLEIKIIMGDKSDNIPSAFPKCGQKTAEKCVQNKEFFKKKMDDNPAYYEQYELNKLLVSFDSIPKELVDEFMETINNELEPIIIDYIKNKTTRVNTVLA